MKLDLIYVVGIETNYLLTIVDISISVFISWDIISGFFLLTFVSTKDTHTAEAMKKHYARLFLSIAQLLILSSLTLILVSLLTSSWVEHDTGQRFGLLEYCTFGFQEECKKRDSILDFRKIPPPIPWPQEPFSSYDLDVITVTFIMAVIFSALSLLLSLGLCCSTSARKKWRLSGTIVTLLLLLSIVFSLVGIAHFEGKKADPKLPKAYHHGWSAIMGWAGFGVGAVACVLSLVVSCVDPDDHSKKPHSVRSTRSSEDTRDTWPCSRDNKAFEHSEPHNRDAYYIGKETSGRGRKERPLSLRRYNDEGAYTTSRDNPAYHTDYHTDYRPNELVYDPRNRTKHGDNRSRRRASIEMAYSSGGDTSDHEMGKQRSKRHTYSSGYPAHSSEHPSTRRYTDSTEDSHHVSVSTAGYDPRMSDISPYSNSNTRPPPPYKHRSSRHSDGHEMR